MKSNHQDIIDELKDLKADFLLKGKQSTAIENTPVDLSEDFFQSVLNNVTEKKDAKVVFIPSVTRKKSFTNIFRIAASFIVLLTVSGIIYSIVTPKATVEIPNQNLQQLISETSSQEIIDYLYENGVPVDEDFLFEFVDVPADSKSKNL